MLNGSLIFSPAILLAFQLSPLVAGAAYVTTAGRC
jgi:hypothetical protein